MTRSNHLLWRVQLRTRHASQAPNYPGSVLAIGPSFQHENMPHEVALLLPTNPGPARLIDDIVRHPALCTDAILGLFLASPFLSTAVESARLRRAGVTWITNLPSVDQQDQEFVRELRDVELDHHCELERLARFRAEGFRIATVVTSASDATSVAAIEPDIIIVLPRVADFAAGFPSLRQRNSSARAVAQAARAAGWSGILLGLGNAQEGGSESVWSTALDGIIYREMGIHSGHF